MAVLNKRAVVSAIEMFGRSSIRLPKVLGDSFSTTIRNLFAHSEQGFFYDPNDLSTMYQDSAGTVPVTGVGQPVGLILDKSKGLELGAEILTNGDFSNGLVGWTPSAEAFVRPNGVVDGKAELEVINATASGNAGITTTINTTIGKWYVASCDVISHNTNQAFVLNITSGLSGTLIYGTGRSVVVFRATTSTTGIRCAVSLNNEVVGQKYYFDNVSVKELHGNHAYQTTSSSRPILRQNATTGAYYLEFDGSDDFLQTSNIDFTVTDEVSLFAGVRRLADGTFGVIAEHGANTDTQGSFAVLSSSGKGYYLQCGTPGDRTLLVSSGGVSAPRSDVVASKMNRAKTDISEMLYSINSQTMSSNLVTIEGQGAIGNFANQPLYIGRRAGTSFPFNGHIYSLIGIGKLTSDAETVAIEKELAKRTGVTLSV